MVEKDMKTVRDYNREQVERMFKFSCFNNACTLHQHILVDSDTINDVFDMAQKLYDEGMRRKWV